MRGVVVVVVVVDGVKGEEEEAESKIAEASLFGRERQAAKGKARQGKRREVNVMFVLFVIVLRWAVRVS